MFSADDSIVAIATPEGRGSIGVIRISGPTALDISQRLLSRPAPLAPRVATFTRVQWGSSGGHDVDEVVATYFPAPRSYTGQDVVEISAHGSRLVLRAIVERAIELGARRAEPGEFTLRGFLNGKKDLIQSEAVADLVNAVTPLQARVAFDQLQGTLTRRIADIDAPLFEVITRLEASLDFPDEGFHFVEPNTVAGTIREGLSAIDQLLHDSRAGRMVREGATVVIAGPPNAGKSSIFNALSGSNRTIVSETPGTTRDLVTELVVVGGFPITLVDTAGWRPRPSDSVEQEGVRRGEGARAAADLILLVRDLSTAANGEWQALVDQTAGSPRLLVGNKADLCTAPSGRVIDGELVVSARRRDGLEALREAIVLTLTGGEVHRDSIPISNARHIGLIRRVKSFLESAAAVAESGEPAEEFILSDLHSARAAFDEILGRRTSEDVLQQIFQRFCVGK